MTDLNKEKARLLDVVDEEDRIIDSKPREEVHRLGLFHREVHVWMFDIEGNIFFQKRGIPVHDAGLLDATVAGHVNIGEEYLHAAVRETVEETSISVDSEDLIFLKKYKNTTNFTKGGFGKIVNNSIRSVYMYKQPITHTQLKEEDGILGVSFKKISSEFLRDMDKTEVGIFRKSVLLSELPEVMKYIDHWKSLQ